MNPSAVLLVTMATSLDKQKKKCDEEPLIVDISNHNVALSILPVFELWPFRFLSQQNAILAAPP